MRQIVLDTETTGLEPEQGHRIIEIGAVELVNRRLTGADLHHYLNPDREIDHGALDVHGITAEFLANKPRFAQILDELLAFVDGSDLVIHNAEFDIGFLNHELRLAGFDGARIEDRCKVVDTLALARRLHPGQKNSLDALCKRYGINNAHRTLHGALLDAQILADVYLSMTGGQTTFLMGLDRAAGMPVNGGAALSTSSVPKVVIEASAEEQELHRRWLELLGDRAVWKVGGG
jgi:DNA polymerase-3 subunit epsilon